MYQLRPILIMTNLHPDPSQSSVTPGTGHFGRCRVRCRVLKTMLPVRKSLKRTNSCTY